jgi:hypothetical protein
VDGEEEEAKEEGVVGAAGGAGAAAVKEEEEEVVVVVEQEEEVAAAVVPLITCSRMHRGRRSRRCYSREAVASAWRRAWAERTQIRAHPPRP